MNVIDSFRLDGKVAVVTGGAGIYGKQITEAVAEAGAKTIIASRNLQTLEAQAREFCDAGLDVTALQYDQSEGASIEALAKQVIDTAGQVDVLVNNSVARFGKGGGWDMIPTEFEKSMKVNAVGVFHMTHIFGDQMAEQGGGSIINIGSIQGMVGPDLTLYEGLDMGVPPPDYFYHKGGMIQLSRFAASALGVKGVRVNTISPGGFSPYLVNTFIERYNARTFVGRMANETDLKGVIVFLASDASVYVTGANIPVDGGYTAK